MVGLLRSTRRRAMSCWRPDPRTAFRSSPIGEKSRALLLALGFMMVVAIQPSIGLAQETTGSPTAVRIKRERISEIRARAMLRPQPVEIGADVAAPLGLTPPG